MTRHTQSYIILKYPTIFPVYIRPLYRPRTLTLQPASSASFTMTFIPSYPLMQPTVRDLFTFPFWMSFILQKKGKSLIEFRRIFSVAFLVSEFFTSFSQFLYQRFSVTLHVAVITWINFGRRLKEYVPTPNARDFNHPISVAII